MHTSYPGDTELDATDIAGDIVEDFPAKPTHLAQRSWLDAFASPAGGTERRRARRTQERGRKKALRVLNRQRFRQHKATLMATTTLKQQVRIYDGLVGTAKQRARVTAQFTTQAALLGQDVDEVVDALRTGLGLDG
jgi:plasmid stabilization system protein ParE